MTGPPRVGLVVGSFAAGGAEGQALMLAHGLARRGWPVRVFVLRAEGPRANEAHGLDVVDLALPKLRFANGAKAIACLARTRRELRAFAPAVVHPWLFEAEAWAWAAMPRGARMVVSRRAPRAWTARRRWQPWLADRIALRASAVVANSPSIAREEAKRVPALRRKLHVVANGLDAASVRSVPADDSLLPAPARDAPFRACFVGALRPMKGHARLVRAWRRVVDAEPSAHLLLAGADEGEGAAVRAEIERLGLEGHAHLLGSVAEPARLMKCCHAYASASEGEGLPNAMMEAMACGLPVAAMDAPGVRDLLGHGKFGALVPEGDGDALADELAALARDAGRARALGSKGRRFVLRAFGADRMVDAYADLYREAAG